MEGKLINTNPNSYHQWRTSSEYHKLVELPLFRSLLRTIHAKSALDIGCGTGLWTNQLASINPKIHVQGIDISDDFIRFANNLYSKPNVIFRVSDAKTFTPTKRVELVTFAMAADYLGAEVTAACIKRSLLPTGSAIVWHFELGRYPLIGRDRHKTWLIDGEHVDVHVHDLSEQEVVSSLKNFNLCSTARRYPFRLSDHQARELVIHFVSPHFRTMEHIAATWDRARESLLFKSG